MNTLEIVKLQFQARILEDIELPRYLGNTIRGALGNTLVRLYCHQSGPNCETCKNKDDCIYAQLFKATRRPEGFATVPNPFVIEVPADNKHCYQKGEELVFRILLFGRAIYRIREIIEAVDQIFMGCFANTKDCIVLEKVWDSYTDQIIYQFNHFVCNAEARIWSDEHRDKIMENQEIKLSFLSPTQILKQKKLFMTWDFSDFMDHLFSRISNMIDLYGKGEFVIPYGLSYRKPHVLTTSNLKKVRIPQGKNFFDGFIGSVTFSGKLNRYMPYIDLGTQLHIGKLTTRGFGKYEIEM